MIDPADIFIAMKGKQPFYGRGAKQLKSQISNSKEAARSLAINSRRPIK